MVMCTVLLSPGKTRPVFRTMWREGRESSVQASTKKAVGVASLLLGLLAWLGERFGLITERVSDWASFGSLVTGVIATFA
jgi:hypothetical protein